MDSFFNTQLAATQRRRPGATTRQPGVAGSSVSGYRLSSFDLITGLEVRTVSINTLPVEVVVELIRMRKLWDGAEPAQGHSEVRN